MSCGSDIDWRPIRLAGICSRYSASAIIQFSPAAVYHGEVDRFFRCPYPAKVMNTLDPTSGVMRISAGESRQWDIGYVEDHFGNRSPATCGGTRLLW